MRIAFLCKRQYMGKDVILDRYARLYEIPFQLARRGHDVLACCLSYQSHDDGKWKHEVSGSGSLHWESRSLGRFKLPELLSYPIRLRNRLRDFNPDVIIGASDIPHVAIGHWLAGQLGTPYVADLYDNFEGFGQARIPGFVSALRASVRHADLILTTSEPLRQLVKQTYGAKGMVISMPSSVDLSVFAPGDQRTARSRLGLPADVPLIGTAGGLYADKGVEPIYEAWKRIANQNPDVHLVLAGPFKSELPPPSGPRVLYLGQLKHEQVADVFRALDVGIISILDTAFGRYCFPQKAYEMLACELSVVASSVGEMASLFANTPGVLFPAGDANILAERVLKQLSHPVLANVPIKDWQHLIANIEPQIEKILQARQGSMR